MNPPERSEIRMGAFAVLKDEQGRVLLVYRMDRDPWCLPGFGERSPLQALRELRLGEKFSSPSEGL